MISINLNFDDSNIEFESKGHCVHDVCIAVSAIINGLKEYALVKESEKKVKIKNNVYKSGSVKLSLDILSGAVDEIENGLEAFVSAFVLYAQNFPEQINCSIKYKGVILF